jgi:hypothetical protein
MTAKRKQPAARTTRELIERAESGTLTAADRAAMAHLDTAMARAVDLATARLTSTLRETAAVLRAQASELPEYALLLPAAPPEYALLGRNTDRAAIAAPEAHTYQLQLGEGESEARAVWQVLGTLTPEARSVLAIICGWWAERDNSQEGERRVVISKRLLAQACYGATDGRAVRRISALLDELGRARLAVGVERTSADGQTELLDPATAQPLVRTARAGAGADTKAAKRNSVLTALLHPELHAELQQHQYQRIRTDLLRGWESWELQLLLRLLTHITTMPTSAAMRRSTTGLHTQLAIGRNAPLELGALGELLPSLADRPPALRARLDRFSEKLAERSRPYELQVLGIRERRAGRSARAPITGWVLHAGYLVRPLTSAQIKKLRRLEQAKQWARLTAELARHPDLAASWHAYRTQYPELGASRVSRPPEARVSIPEARVSITATEPENRPRAIGEQRESNNLRSRLEKPDSESVQHARDKWPDLDSDTRRLLKARYGYRLADLPD